MYKSMVQYLLMFALLAATSPALAAQWLYSVRPGDTLWDLCRQYTNRPDCWQTLGPANKVVFPKRLPPGYIIAFPVSWLKEVPRPVKVTYTSGAPQVRLFEGDEFSVLEVGQALPIGALIKTEKGTANLEFADGSLMQLEADAELLLDALSTVDGVNMTDSRLRLNRGAVKTRVTKRQQGTRFKITTPAAVAAVRGTEYRVSSDLGVKAVMRSEVFEGVVDVSASQAVEPVVAGFGLQTKEGLPPEPPRELLPAPELALKTTSMSLPAEIRWLPVDGAHAYQMEVLLDNNYEQNLQRQVVTSTTFLLDQLQPGCYRLRLRAIDDVSLQGLAQHQRICVMAGLDTLKVTQIEQQERSRTRVNLRWSPVSQAVSYRLVVARDRGFRDIISDDTAATPEFLLVSAKQVYYRTESLAADGAILAASEVMTWRPRRWTSTLLFGLDKLAD